MRFQPHRWDKTVLNWGVRGLCLAWALPSVLCSLRSALCEGPAAGVSGLAGTDSPVTYGLCPEDWTMPGLCGRRPPPSGGPWGGPPLLAASLPRPPSGTSQLLDGRRTGRALGQAAATRSPGSSDLTLSTSSASFLVACGESP